MSKIYLDTHASALVRPEALERFNILSNSAGNPASLHSAGRDIRWKMESSRDLIKQFLGGAKDDELVFTSSATEANNLALFGQLSSGDHVLATRLEHPCIIGPLEHLEKNGVAVDWLPLPTTGIANPASFAEKLRPETKLAVLMGVNHETGVFQPVEKLRELLPASVKLHVDASQMVGRYPVDFRKMGATTLSFSGHKFGTPKGIGGLLIREGTIVKPMMFGGHQQKGIRPGTESPALVDAMAIAIMLATREIEEVVPKIAAIKARFKGLLKDNIRGVMFNGSDNASAYALNVSFPIQRAELLQIKLDLAGVQVSTGSACSSGSALPSPVLLAMNLPEAEVRGAIRFSFGLHLSNEDISRAAQIVAKAVKEMVAAKL